MSNVPTNCDPENNPTDPRPIALTPEMKPWLEFICDAIDALRARNNGLPDHSDSDLTKVTMLTLVDRGVIGIREDGKFLFPRVESKQEIAAMLNDPIKC